MGLDARRGASFPPERYDDILREGETKSQRSSGSISQAAGERWGDMQVKAGNTLPLCPRSAYCQMRSQRFSPFFFLSWASLLLP